MVYSFIWYEVEWALEEMSFYEFGLATIVRNHLLIDHRFTNPGGTYYDVNKAVVFLLDAEGESWVGSKNLIRRHEIIVISIFIEFKEKLLLKLKISVDGSRLVLVVTEIDLLDHKVLSDENVVQ